MDMMLRLNPFTPNHCYPEHEEKEEEEEKVFIANSKGMVWMRDTSEHPNAKLRPQ